MIGENLTVLLALYVVLFAVHLIVTHRKAAQVDAVAVTLVAMPTVAYAIILVLRLAL